MRENIKQKNEQIKNEKDNIIDIILKKTFII